MKKTIQLGILVAFLVISNFSVAQQDMATLEKETEKMHKASIELKFDEIVEYSYPKIFDLIPKDQMGDVLRKTFENEDFSISFLPTVPNFKYSKIKKIEDKYLSIIDYNIGMRMAFSEKLDEEMVELMINTLKTQENYEDINFDTEKNTFFIKGHTTMIAVNDQLTKKQWKFITYDSKKRKLAEMLLSDDILTKLGL